MTYSASLIYQTRGYCVLSRLVSRITYHTDQEFLDLVQQGWSQPSRLWRHKREPMTALTLSLLLGASLGELGMGISAPVTQNQDYSNLHVTIDMGIESTEKSISLPRGVLILPGGGSLAEQEGIGSSLLTAGWALCSTRGRMLFLH